MTIASQAISETLHDLHYTVLNPEDIRQSNPTIWNSTKVSEHLKCSDSTIVPVPVPSNFGGG
jgi:predicted lipase